MCLQAVPDGGKIFRLTMTAPRGPSHHCVSLVWGQAALLDLTYEQTTLKV